MITLRQLRYLSALAKHGHFGRAAEACAVTQPALSMQIRDLERTLGVAVVERRPGDVMLTDVGREIARRAEDVLTASRDLVDFARHRSGLLTGRLTLGVIPSLAPYLLPRILPLLQTRFPELRLELRETQTRQLIEDIKSGALDAAMLALPVTEPDVDTIALFEDLFLLAVPANDPHPENVRVAAEDIDQSRLILLEDGHCLRDQALAFCATAARTSTAGHGVATVFGASSLNTVMQMVAGGYGVTLIPQIAADVERRDERVKFLRLENPQPGRSIGLVFRRTSPRKADFSALGEVVKESHPLSRMMTAMNADSPAQTKRAAEKPPSRAQ
ncbi:MAG TPA: LysR substrate-binding domain-containing protein [Bradyrhizobium sp.]|nr:LysR substrate-binding domain-containing protein [Bradyrhizobium sp.]